MPSASDVARLRQANNALAVRVERDLDDFWGSLNLERPEAARDSLLRFVPALTTAYGDAAAVLAADWYDEIRATDGVPGRFTAVLADAFPVEYVQARVRFGAGHLFTDTPGDLLPFLSGVVQEYALQPGRDTVQRSSIEDPRASGWQRQVRTSGCSFCRMLAGRGGVYRKETATFAAHGNCGCVAVPSWDPDAPEVPASAYVASQRTSRMADAQKQAHTARVRDFVAALD